MAPIQASTAAENARGSLARRQSAEIQLSPTRSAGNLIANAGAESASKARQLRHAATFSIRYHDPDAKDEVFGSLLRRHLHSRSEKNLMTPPRKTSAKLERALQVHDRCERDLERFCESKHRSFSSSRSPSRQDMLDKSFWLDPDNVHDDHAQDKCAFDRLMRKLSPAMKNSATTHGDLIHILHNCAECSTRLAFCARCATKATEFFENYSATELQMLYCRELPPADAKALDTFADAMAQREYHATH